MNQEYLSKNGEHWHLPLTDDTHDDIIEEIARREHLDYDEEISDNDDWKFFLINVNVI